MTVQELREEIVQKTEEINGYLESRDADKAEEALAEKRKLQKLLAVREAEDDEEREDLGRQKKQKESRSTGAVSELRAAVNIDGNAAILPEQFVNDIQVLRAGFPSLKNHCHVIKATSNHGKMPFAKIGGKKLKKYKSGTKLTGEAANTEDIKYDIENYGSLVPIANDLQEDEAVNIVQEVIKPDFAEAGVNTENDEIMQIVEANAVDKSTGAKDWRDVKKIIDGVLPTLRGRVVVITNLSGSVYLKSQEDKNGRNLDLVKEVNGKEYFQGKELITLSDEDITASTTEKMIFYVVNLYALVKFFERKGYTVSTDKSVFFESDELALKVQERFDCEKLDDRADFKIEFAAA